MRLAGDLEEMHGVAELTLRVPEIDELPQNRTASSVVLGTSKAEQLKPASHIEGNAVALQVEHTQPRAGSSVIVLAGVGVSLCLILSSWGSGFGVVREPRQTPASFLLALVASKSE
jgi:hypothetical protein